MKVSLLGIRRVFINGEYIRLDALLKFAAEASSGGEAKAIIQEGLVFVGGEQITKRGRKIKPGDVVRCSDRILLVKRLSV